MDSLSKRIPCNDVHLPITNRGTEVNREVMVINQEVIGIIIGINQGLTDTRNNMINVNRDLIHKCVIRPNSTRTLSYHRHYCADS